MDAAPAGCVLSIPLDVGGEAFAFVALEDGSLIIDDQQGEESLEPVATAVERRVDRPYRARGFRTAAGRWVVVADPVELVDLGALRGSSLTLVALSGERRLVIDDVVLGADALPEALADEAYDSEPCVISAENVDEQWWELTVEELPEEVASERAPAEPAVSDDAADEPAPPVSAPVAPPQPAPAPRSGWTLTATVDAPGLAGEALDLVVADAGTIVVLGGTQQPDGLLVPFRTRIEAELRAPYRAHAERADGDAWRLQARPARIERFTCAGSELELTHRGGLSSLVVDGQPRPGTVPRLEVVGLTVAGPTYVARATYLRDDLWDVSVERG